MFTSHAQLITSSWSTIEDGKQIKQWYPIVLLQNSYDEDETSFEIATHGNEKHGASKPYVHNKMSPNQKASPLTRKVSWSHGFTAFRDILEPRV